jgi:hypothetical protein
MEDKPTARHPPGFRQLLGEVLIRRQQEPVTLRAWWRALGHKPQLDSGSAIREAAAAGLSLSYIQKITGLGKTTIMRILNDRPRPRP